jgi:histidyl-tRNA synthetase
LLRKASKIGAHYALIVGEEEIARGTVQLRDLRLSNQREVSSADAAKLLAAECRQTSDHEPVS